MEKNPSPLKPMKNPKCGMMTAASIIAYLLGTWADAQVTYTQPLSGIIDPDGTTVTRSIAAPPNELTTFQSEVDTAFQTGNGGVYELPTAVTGGTTVFVGNGQGEQAKTFSITFNRPIQQFTPGATFLPSSGARGITTQTTGGDYGMTFGPVKEGTTELSHYNITKFGFVVMSRNETPPLLLDIRATMSLSDGSTQSLTANFPNTRGINVFYGFTAPAGQTFTGLTLEGFAPGTTNPVVARIGLDDMAIVTEVARVSLTPITAENAYVPANGAFQFRAFSVEDIQNSNLTMNLNGVNANSQLTLSGPVQDRVVSIGGLAPEMDYTATVTLSNASGTTTRTFLFNTKEPAPTINLISRNGSYIHPSTSFQIGATPALNGSISPQNSSLILNGQNASGQMTFSAPPGTQVITIKGLQPNRTYQAEAIIGNTYGRSSTRAFTFHTQGDPLRLSDTKGFSDTSVYPLGNLSPFTDGLTRWAPFVGDNSARIVDSEDPAYGNVLRRQQGDVIRADYLYFPPLADGKITLTFDARVSDPTHRSLDLSLQPDLTNTMSSFLQFGHIPERLSFFDHVNYMEIGGFELDTNWHNYRLVHYMTGPYAKKYDLYIDGVLFGAKLPWRTSFLNPLTRVRIQTNAREVTLPLPTGEEHTYADLDNIVIEAMPLDTAPFAEPVEVTQLGQGVTYKRYSHTNLFNSPQQVFVTDINLNDPSVGIKFPNSNGTLRTVPTHASNVASAVAAVNGQFYDTSTFNSIQFLKVNGTLINPTIEGAHDSQAIIDDGLGTPESIRMMQRPGTGWENSPLANIMASGPYLFENGIKWTAYDPADTTFVPVRHPRTAAAWTFDNHLLLIVADGGRPQAAGMTIPELQEYIDRLGWIRFSTNYDGGGSSTMWTNGGGVVNAPSGGSPRAVANAIAVTAAPVAVPVTPANIVGVMGDDQVSLSWQISSGATSYEILRSTSPTGPFSVIGTASNPWFTDTGAASGTTYYYVIAAINSAGRSADSAPLGTGSTVAIVVPAVTITRTASTFSLTFPSQTGRTYQLQRSTTLMLNSWENIGAAAPGTGAEMTLPHTLSGNAAFYRILIE